MYNSSSRCWLGLFGLLLPLASGTWLLGADASSSPPDHHINLPPAFAGTPQSFQIAAEAQYVAARGDLVESVAVARKIHAEAVAQEIQNSIDYVDAYFQRRALNRKYRAEENPTYLQAEQRRYEIRRQTLENHLQQALKGNLTDSLNWLLTELSGPMLAYQYLPDQSSVRDSELNPELNPDDLNHVWLSDGGRGGSRVIVSAGNPMVLETRWPLALRHPQLNPQRKSLEACRDSLLSELTANGTIRYETLQQLLTRTNDMLLALDEVYPVDERKEFRVFTAYNSGKRYLRSLAAQAHRIAKTSDKTLLDGSLRFEGSRLLDLIQFMDRNGLVFAAPQEGDERVYRSLLTDMRGIWLVLSKDDAS